MSDALKTLMAGDREAVLETVASILHLGNVEFDETKDDASGALETSVRAGASRTALEVRRRVSPPPPPRVEHHPAVGNNADALFSVERPARVRRASQDAVQPSARRSRGSRDGATHGRSAPPLAHPLSRAATERLVVVTVVAPASSPTAPPRRARAKSTQPQPTHKNRRRRGCSGSTAPTRAASTRARAR